MDAYFTEQEIATLAPGASEGNHAEGALQRWPLTSDIVCCIGAQIDERTTTHTTRA